MSIIHVNLQVHGVVSVRNVVSPKSLQANKSFQSFFQISYLRGGHSESHFMFVSQAKKLCQSENRKHNFRHFVIPVSF